MKRGSARVVDGRVYARVRYGKDERLDVRVTWAATKEDAEARAEIIAGLVDVLVEHGRRDLVKSTAKRAAEADSPKALDTVRKAVRAIVAGSSGASRPADLTFYDWAESWVTGELHKKYPDHVPAKDHSDDISRLRLYIYPRVKDVPVTAFRASHAELVMAKLPVKLSPASRRHVAQIMVRLMNLAALRQIVTASPLPRGWLPRIKGRKHYSCLYPREESMLLAQRDIAEVFRLFCGILNREGMRLSELWDSEWWQWNLDEGTFLATKTKTGDPRLWALRPDVARAMRLWRDRRSDLARPFVEMDELTRREKVAEFFRLALAASGVTRAELFETTEHTGKLRAHDMRATFVTVSLAEGKNETWIRDHTAHKTTAMVDRYRRQARQFEELKVGPLADLVQAMGWGMSRGTQSKSAGSK